MRIVIDIEGDQVRVHRIVGDTLPPADLLSQAAVLDAASAGMALVPGAVSAFDSIRAEETDAGRAPTDRASARAATAKAARPQKRTPSRKPARRKRTAA